mmetsp:Transcript_24025/g.59935  ORF Transcript_24025/g.59935 Transcript_24025/m.59935 type:complete len:213 (+) Transcript_24025:1309-1947(+)
MAAAAGATAVRAATAGHKADATSFTQEDSETVELETEAISHSVAATATAATGRGLPCTADVATSAASEAPPQPSFSAGLSSFVAHVGGDAAAALAGAATSDDAASGRAGWAQPNSLPSSAARGAATAATNAGEVFAECSSSDFRTASKMESISAGRRTGGDEGLTAGDVRGTAAAAFFAVPAVVALTAGAATARRWAAALSRAPAVVPAQRL